MKQGCCSRPATSTRSRLRSSICCPTVGAGLNCGPRRAVSSRPSATGPPASPAIDSRTTGSPARRVPPTAEPEPRIVVLTTLFPHAGQPTAGLFIRERMSRVARLVPVTVVAPVPWFPCQGLLRHWRPHFRPLAVAMETQEGIEVRRPRFLSVPGALKWLDGFFLAVACLPTLLRLRRSFAFNLIDAHFAYPEGYAATLLGRWVRLPVSITLRGTEVPLSRDPRRRSRMIVALQRATRIFSVSESLKRHATMLGVAGDKIMVVANGVDTGKFHRLNRQAARQRLGL